ncbi:MAG: thiamine pyrophosphate-binding protein [Alphaproteobacteria bacterium]|nr:thiamine pyrophosphate-binding protein [Alphaproteobacteria bacterium]
MPKPQQPSQPSRGRKDNQAIERPLPSSKTGALFGSDIIAETLRALDMPYIAVTPGASFRGLHDSIVNHLGNERPTMLLCLREDHAVAVAHGYAKVTGRTMAAAVHSNVGLFNATIAMFNAWCDRMPVVVIGATGPVDAAQRRPWIDWIHTARDQGAIVRGYTKWDDQPASPIAAREALIRGKWIAGTMPMGPVYVNLDAGMQEMSLQKPLRPIETARYVPSVPTAAPDDLIKQAAKLLSQAKRPIILAGRVSRNIAAWDARVKLAEALNAHVITDLKVGAAFPSEHPLHIGAPTASISDEAGAALKAADVVLSLDWVDLAGTLKVACGGAAPNGAVIQVSLDHHLHTGWNMDYQALPPIDLMLAADPDAVVPALIGALSSKRGAKLAQPGRQSAQPSVRTGKPISIEQLGHALRRALGTRPASLLHLPISWNAEVWPFSHPLDFIGGNGGGGVGAGPGLAVGAALALKDSGRLPVAIVGDGDFLMGATALWTAVHYRIPLLLVVANNTSFFNDEMHQERVALARERPVENRWIGQRISDPDIDLAAIARAQGTEGFGPVVDPAALPDIYKRAIAVVDEGGVAVVDVRIQPGYSAATTAGMTRTAEE